MEELLLLLSKYLLISATEMLFSYTCVFPMKILERKCKKIVLFLHLLCVDKDLVSWLFLPLFGGYFVLSCFVPFISLNQGELMTFCIQLELQLSIFHGKKLSSTTSCMEEFLRKYLNLNMIYNFSTEEILSFEKVYPLPCISNQDFFRQRNLHRKKFCEQLFTMITFI